LLKPNVAKKPIAPKITANTVLIATNNQSSLILTPLDVSKCANHKTAGVVDIADTMIGVVRDTSFCFICFYYNKFLIIVLFIELIMYFFIFITMNLCMTILA
jgi:hypothetical protein